MKLADVAELLDRALFPAFFVQAFVVLTHLDPTRSHKDGLVTVICFFTEFWLFLGISWYKEDLANEFDSRTWW